jgi:hypothetical protein
VSETVLNLPAQQAPRREIQTVVDAVPILDTARFEHMQRIANIMARSSMIPETLRTEGRGNDKVPLPFEQVLSNCFLVVNQAARWGFDPFAVVSCCAVVHGRLSYEGKLVSAVLDAKLGIKLHHHFTGNPTGEDFRIYLSDKPFTDELVAELKPGFSKNGWRVFDGSVAEWKTAGAGTPWTPKNFKRMLIYRGTRDWTRIYESALMLGVYSDDEMLDLVEDARARRATPVASLSLADRLTAAKATGTGQSDGFSHEHVTRETSGMAQESQSTNGDAGHRELPHDATLHDDQQSLRSGATDAHASPDRVETVDGTTSPRGAHEVASQESETQTSDSPNSDSAQLPQVPESDTLAVENGPPSATASNLSESASSPGVDEGTEGGVGDASPPSLLPVGWAVAYAGALRRAQSKASLPKFAKQFWAQYGSWEDHKDGADGPTAVAIYDAFAANFGRPELIDEALRELI